MITFIIYIKQKKIKIKNKKGVRDPDHNRDDRGVKLFHIKNCPFAYYQHGFSITVFHIQCIADLCDPLSIIILTNFHSQLLSWRVSKSEDFHFFRRFLTDFAQNFFFGSHLAKLSRIVRKPDFSLGENKGADQLRGNREADQRLCFRYTDSTISLLLKSEISSF